MFLTNIAGKARREAQPRRDFGKLKAAARYKPATPRPTK
jgi:hypothetical protein